jgi:hypothetical protein
LIAICHIVEPPFLLDRRLHVVLLADRHAAAGDDQVVAGGGAAQRLAGGVEPVGNDAEVFADAAHRLDQAAQGEAVGVVDRSGLERFARHRELVAGENKADARPGTHWSVRRADRRRPCQSACGARRSPARSTVDALLSTSSAAVGRID